MYPLQFDEAGRIMYDKKAIRQAIAGRLKKAREQAGYSSAALFCEKHNLPLERYLGHEEAQLMLNASAAMKYSRLLGVSLKTLLIGDNSL